VQEIWKTYNSQHKVRPQTETEANCLLLLNTSNPSQLWLHVCWNSQICDICDTYLLYTMPPWPHKYKVCSYTMVTCHPAMQAYATLSLSRAHTHTHTHKIYHFLCWCYNPVWVLGSSTAFLQRLWRFRWTVDFRVGYLAPCPTPNLEDQGLHFIWPLHFELSGMGGPTMSLSSSQHSSLHFTGGWKQPLHTKAVFLREDINTTQYFIRYWFL
jgi:hypothetical protein